MEIEEKVPIKTIKEKAIIQDVKTSANTSTNDKVKKP